VNARIGVVNAEIGHREHAEKGRVTRAVDSETGGSEKEPSGCQRSDWKCDRFEKF
jgi:hypothetical protein